MLPASIIGGFKTFLDGEKYFLYEVKDTLYVRSAFYLQYIHDTSLELHDKIVRF